MAEIQLQIEPGDKIVELGGGIEGRALFHPNVDVQEGPGVDIVADLNKPFPLGTGEFTGIYSRFVIEHIYWANLPQFLSECYRILKDGGRAILITANTYEQCRIIVERGDDGFDRSLVSMLFGGQGKGGSEAEAHKCGFSPQYAIKLLRSAGFARVTVYEYPGFAPEIGRSVEIIIQADKAPLQEKAIMPSMRELAFWEKPAKPEYDLGYFDSTAGTGYGPPGYHDFPAHWKMVREILKRKPKSVIEFGCGRGYVLKKLEAYGIGVLGVDIAEHCFHTRAVRNFILGDACDKLPVKDKQFTLAFSHDFWEHLPPDRVNDAIKESVRVSRQGFHGITFSTHPNAKDDPTHLCLQPKEWWVKKFKKLAPKYPVEIVDKNELEGPVTSDLLPQGDNLVKLNLGSFLDCFHYGWINLDIRGDIAPYLQERGYIFRQSDFRKGLDYDTDSVDLIFSSHTLEHFTYDEGLNFLKECYRVMKAEALIRIIVPDADHILNVYKKHELRSYYKCVNAGVANAKSESDALFHLLFEGHKTMYNERALTDILKQAGFADIKPMSFGVSQSEVMQREAIDMYPTMSLIVEARKGSGAIIGHGEKPLYQKYLNGEAK